MKRKIFPIWRGFTVQLFAITVLPLTLLLLVIAFGSIALHQKDMRALVGERDERAVQAASAALESELHHRMASVSSLSALADASGDLVFEEALATSLDLMSDFDGGVAFLDSKGILRFHGNQAELWHSIFQNGNGVRLASLSNPGPVISIPFVDPSTNRIFVIVSAYSASTDTVTAGAFSPESLAQQTPAASYPRDSQARIYLLDASAQTLYVGGTSAEPALDASHPGVAEALRGKSGTKYVQVDN